MAQTTVAVRTRVYGPFGTVPQVRLEKKQLTPDLQQLPIPGSHPMEEWSVIDVAQA